MSFELDPSYKDVPARIADFKAKHPEGCLRPLDPERPFWIEPVDGRLFVCYAAAAYRTPDDPMPGVGVAWEPYPGKTPYTRDSELQNAETSAWGRAIVAVLASESKSVASAEDVRNRRAEAAAPPGDYEPPPPIPPLTDEQEANIRDWLGSLTDEQGDELKAWWKANLSGPLAELNTQEAVKCLAHLIATYGEKGAAAATSNEAPEGVAGTSREGAARQGDGAVPGNNAASESTESASTAPSLPLEAAPS